MVIIIILCFLKLVFTHEYAAVDKIVSKYDQ